MWKTFCNVNLKGPADRQTAAFKRKIREYVKSGGDVEDGDDIVSAQAVSPVKVHTSKNVQKFNGFTGIIFLSVITQ